MAGGGYVAVGYARNGVRHREPRTPTRCHISLRRDLRFHELPSRRLWVKSPGRQRGLPSRAGVLRRWMLPICHIAPVSGPSRSVGSSRLSCVRAARDAARHSEGPPYVTLCPRRCRGADGGQGGGHYALHFAVCRGSRRARQHHFNAPDNRCRKATRPQIPPRNRQGGRLPVH